MQRSGNGSGRHGQHVHVVAERLEPLLVGDPEAVLLVDDHQAQVLELHVPLEQPVGADDDVHLATPKLLHHPPLLRPGAEAAQHLHAHGEGAQPLREGGVVLLGQHRGGHQHRHLLAVHGRLEGGPQGYLRLAVPHVAAHQPVRGPGLFHVALDLGNGLSLVRGLHVG